MPRKTPKSPTVLPILPWVGGKRHLIPLVLSTLSTACPGRSFDTLISPFLGGAAIELNLLSSGIVQRAILSDINARLVTQYAHVRDDYKAVHADLQRLEQRMDHALTRAEINAGTLTPGALIWLVTRSFSGLYRENRSGGCNSPFDAAKTRPLPTLERLRDVSRLMRRVPTYLWTRTFQEALAAKVDAGTLILLDPPYLGTYGQYSATNWTEQSTDELFRLVREKCDEGAVVVLTETTAVNGYLDALRSDGYSVTVELRVKNHVMNGARKVDQTELVAVIQRATPSPGATQC